MLSAHEASQIATEILDLFEQLDALANLKKRFPRGIQQMIDRLIDPIENRIVTLLAGAPKQ